MKKVLLVPVFAALVSPLAVFAESSVNTATTAGASASAHVDFRVTVPQVLFLQVGTGTNLAAGATIDFMDFTVQSSSVGNGTAVAAAASSGDLANGAVTVRVLSNGIGTAASNGVTLNSTTGGLMKNAAGQTIGWDQITVTKGTLAAQTNGYSNLGIDHPTFNNTTAGGSGTAVKLTPSTAGTGVVAMEGKWTYAYANTAPVAAGTYGGQNLNNGRVTYTATAP